MVSPIQARTDALSADMLQTMAEALVTDPRAEADEVLMATLASLESKIPAADFLAFCRALEAAL
ncbi:hypothetical protein [Caulobacter sp. 3R27C2-B]|uniref:hypothetical protein n=1 Tax=Caulobacter sp. 3R27C2-B TaxID=2502219 RepID=UPI0010F611AB|nr:hypothetical protein [Caulobacter sp. 3R27C2-B]